MVTPSTHEAHATELRKLLDEIHRQKGEIIWLRGELTEACRSESHERLNAPDILIAAADVIQDREGERCMPTAVATYNTLTGHKLTERDGWIFITILKFARTQGGSHCLDDYIYAAACTAQAGECAEAV